MNELIVVLVPIAVVVALVMLLVLVTFNALYDVISSYYNSHLSPQRVSMTPHVTVIITVDDNLEAVRSCLSNLHVSSHKQYDVVLANNHRQFETADTLRKSVAALPVPSRYYKSRKVHSYERLIKEAYKRSKKGSLVVLVDSGVSFDVSTLQRIAEMHELVVAGKILHLDTITPRSGFIGVVLLLLDCFNHLLRESTFRLAAFKSNNLQTRTVVSSRYLTNHRISTGRSYYPGIVVYGEKYHVRYKVMSPRGIWMLLKIILLGFMLLVSITTIRSAVDGSGVESFMVAWAALAMTGISIVIFDGRTTKRQKLETMLSLGFMPILMMMSFFVSVVTHRPSINT